LGADGARSLLAAARVAGSAPGLGAVLVLDDTVHAARWARKQDSRSTAAFGSPGHGPLGRVGGPLQAPPRRWTVAPPAALDRPVPVLHAYTGMEERVVGAVLEATAAAGLVLAGTGLGNV